MTLYWYNAALPLPGLPQVGPHLNFIAAVARLTLLEARRTRLPWLLAGVAIISLSLAAFVSQVAITEAREIQIAFLAALLRAASVFLIALFAITSVTRDAADKFLDMLLAQPVPRSAYFLGKLTGVLSAAATVALLASLLVFTIAPGGGVPAWGMTLFGELLVTTTVALFCALSLPGMVGAFAATTGFYLLSRTIDTLQFIAANPLAPSGGMTDRIVRGLVDTIALFLPGLDGAAKTAWLITSPPPTVEWLSLLAGLVLYGALICAATLFDLYRRNL